MTSSARTEFIRLIRQESDTDRSASAVRRATGWWMGAFVALFDRELRRLLMVQLGDYARDGEGRYPWTLPGGSVEPDEPATAAAARELLEETGIEPSEALTTAAWLARPYYQSHRSTVRGEFIVLFAARCDLPAVPPRAPNDETRGARFFTFDARRGTVEHPADERDAWYPPHWLHWAACAYRRLSGELSEPAMHVYESAAALQAPLPGHVDDESPNRGPGAFPPRP
jgi:8-oxo-dGTP pyrophosphatase MutT (NUDIX family)